MVRPVVVVSLLSWIDVKVLHKFSTKKQEFVAVICSISSFEFLLICRACMHIVHSWFLFEKKQVKSEFLCSRLCYLPYKILVLDYTEVPASSLGDPLSCHQVTDHHRCRTYTD